MQRVYDLHITLQRLGLLERSSFIKQTVGRDERIMRRISRRSRVRARAARANRRIVNEPCIYTAYVHDKTHRINSLAAIPGT